MSLYALARFLRSTNFGFGLPWFSARIIPILANIVGPLRYDEDHGLNSIQPVGLDAFDARKTHQEFGVIPERPRRLAAGNWNGVVKAGGPEHQPSFSISALVIAVAFSTASCRARVFGAQPA
jgi:hypothetical protein